VGRFRGWLKRRRVGALCRLKGRLVGGLRRRLVSPLWLVCRCSRGIGSGLFSGLISRQASRIVSRCFSGLIRWRISRQVSRLASWCFGEVCRGVGKSKRWGESWHLSRD